MDALFSERRFLRSSRRTIPPVVRYPATKWVLPSRGSGLCFSPGESPRPPTVFQCSTTNSDSMIQRIQTVYLFLGALALMAFGVFDLPWNSAAASTHVWFVPSLIGLLVLTSGTALWSIFLYEDRERQRTVVVGVQLGTVLVAGVLYGGLYLTSELTFTGPQGIDWGRT